MYQDESKIHYLDLSWTKEYIRSINSQTLLEREPMEFIQLTFLYIDAHSTIDRIEKEEYKLVFDPSSNGCWLLEDTVLRIIQTRKLDASTGHRYKLDDILSYIVTVDPMHLTEYGSEKGIAKNLDGSGGIRIHEELKTISIPGAIHIPSSFFIFHRINTIYFIFRQLVRVPNDVHKTAAIVSPLSILKTGKEPSKKTTKRVRISPILPKHTHSSTSKIRILSDESA